jgi:hypothetical protein
MTPAQLATLKTNILANTATIPSGQPWTGAFAGAQVKDVPNSSDGNVAVAGWYNLAATPAYKVYRSSVPMSEIMLNGFDWTRVDNLSVGKARIWDWMVNADPSTQSIDPSKTNIRTGINAVWVGTAQDLAVRAAVYLHCFRDASNAEKLFKTAGNGTACDASGDGPATNGLTEPVSASDVNSALNLPA